MPYIRLYSKTLSLGEKRLIARQLISITQHSFGLPDDRCRNITVQFAPAHESRPEYCAVVEVSGQNLDAASMAEFVSAVSPVLANRFGRRRLRWLFGVARCRAKLIAVEFNQMTLRGVLASSNSSAASLNAVA
jgi:hypothetical protein